MSILGESRPVASDVAAQIEQVFSRWKRGYACAPDITWDIDVGMRFSRSSFACSILVAILSSSLRVVSSSLLECSLLSRLDASLCLKFFVCRKTSSLAFEFLKRGLVLLDERWNCS